MRLQLSPVENIEVTPLEMGIAAVALIAVLATFKGCDAQRTAHQEVMARIERQCPKEAP
jgi:hypothetical protein